MEALYDRILDDGRDRLEGAAPDSPRPPLRAAGVTALTAMRGAGKTSALLALGARLLRDGAPAERVAYLDLADPRLDARDPLLPTRLLDRLFARHPSARLGRVHLLLDGADLNDGWGRTLDRLLDVYDLHLALAGEQASWLEERPDGRLPRGTEVVELRPRALAQLNAPRLQELAPLAVTHQARIQSLRSRASGQPGGPRSVDAACCLELAALAWAATGRPFSTTAAAAALHERGWTATRPQVDRFMGLLKEGHLVYGTPEFSAASKPNPRSAQRVYAGHPDLARACASGGSPTDHALASTAVYLRLRALGAQGAIYSYQVGETPSERARSIVDFAVGSPGTGAVSTLVLLERPRRGAWWPTPAPAPKDLRLLERAMAQADLRRAVLVGPPATPAQDLAANAGVIHRLPLDQALLDTGIELG